MYTKVEITQEIYRYAVANNKHMRDQYNLNKLISYLIFLDAKYLCMTWFLTGV